MWSHRVVSRRGLDVRAASASSSSSSWPRTGQSSRCPDRRIRAKAQLLPPDQVVPEHAPQLPAHLDALLHQALPDHQAVPRERRVPQLARHPPHSAVRPHLR